MRAGALLVVAACGRLHFDQVGVAGGDDGSFAGSGAWYLKASNTDLNDAFGNGLAMSADGRVIAIGAGDESSAATGLDGNQADNSAMYAGAVYLFEPAPATWMQTHYMKASSVIASGYFGYGLVMSADGATLAAGSYGYAALAGAVYVFEHAGSWSQTALLTASNSEAVDEFGAGLAMSADGTTLAVGARLEDSAATGIGGNQLDNTAMDSGAVYVFVRTGTTWTQQAYIKASNTNAGDWFGETVALSADGNTLAVGAPFESSAATGIGGNQLDNSATKAGAVYVFTRAGATWTQQAYVKASNTFMYYELGTSLALSADGNTLAVGSPSENSSAVDIGGNQADHSATNAGAVYVFARAGTWSQQAYVKAHNTRPQAYFGNAVALAADGNTLLVGSYLESSAATGLDGDESDSSRMQAGAAYVLVRSGATWAHHTYVKALNTDVGDQFGGSLAISGDASTLVIGARYEASAATGVDGDEADNSVTQAGAAYLFR